MRNVPPLVLNRLPRAWLLSGLIPSSAQRLRKLRHHLPYPRLWSLVFGNAIPDVAITTKSLKLDRPESIHVSDSGDQVVISNSASCEILFCSLSKHSSRGFRAKRLAGILDKERFKYAHGAIFGFSDAFVMALGEYSHCLSAIRLTKAADGEVQPAIIWTISGREHGLYNPADLALHPSKQWLAVANRRQLGLSFLRFSDTADLSNPTVAGSIDIPTLNGHGLAAPHGVAFSSDGDFMFVTHKRFFQSRGDRGHSALSVFATADGSLPHGGVAPLAVLDYQLQSLHHVACHPSLDIVAITNSRGTIDVLEWSRRDLKLTQLAAILAFRIGEGVKGVAFTRDGAYIMVTSELNEILFFRLGKVVQKM